MSDTYAGLIAPAGGTKFYEGAGIFESVSGMVDSLTQRNFLAAGGNFVASSLAALGTIMDPLQSLFAAGVGWAMEHVDVLREPLDKLMGDPKAIEGHADSWKNIERRIYETTELFVAEVKSTTAVWTAASAAAFRKRARAHAETVQATGAIADALSKATTALGAVVGIARNTIRDIIAQVVGAIISKLLQAATAVLLPKALMEVAVLVSQTSIKILTVMKELVLKIKEIGSGIEKLSRMIEKLTSAKLDVTRLMTHRVEAAGVAREGWTGPVKAYAALTLGDARVYGPIQQVLINTGRSAAETNTSQNSGSAADSTRKKDPEPNPVDLPD
ncbi:hypothetical protein GCM10010112_88880 [Actinoplanes lobatus]|uniref:Uncharacterized protein n=1 Tax=Actinoplanes lobatus TaxID=113568 RepID=A0A7W7HQR9_9ACTN|nr:hypothetical protein [Actinoplanes lobatus]MBB4754930.1 hypothetical protein [Actinoplanes lobatus]GGN97059.1 hypothetical protein GCM10010112_88880 [Actinoplanes lobatus]GIE44540.1 hypothetical protein Alo02nite_74380 [Actinoplanes lobatus]